METEEWQQFYRSGKVADYLAYREAAENEAAFIQDRKEEAVNHAGICHSDGNDLTGASYGRI
ncbi:MAG: hypothetical protein J1E61_09800 [Lachnospiraceae bacterium]|nr:hypothetical protein [Lachnospiraceae bacterium]